MRQHWPGILKDLIKDSENLKNLRFENAPGSFKDVDARDLTDKIGRVYLPISNFLKSLDKINSFDRNELSPGPLQELSEVFSPTWPLFVNVSMLLSNFCLSISMVSFLTVGRFCSSQLREGRRIKMLEKNYGQFLDLWQSKSQLEICTWLGSATRNENSGI